jgi:hypothetical protein
MSWSAKEPPIVSVGLLSDGEDSRFNGQGETSGKFGKAAFFLPLEGSERRDSGLASISA